MGWIEILEAVSGAIQALVIIGGAILFLVSRYKKPDELSNDIKELSDELKVVKDNHDNDMKKLRDEIKGSNAATQQSILLMRDDLKKRIDNINGELCQVSYENGAMLDGLIQMGCNGEVTNAKEAHDKRLNKQAHNQNI